MESVQTGKNAGLAGQSSLKVTRGMTCHYPEVLLSIPDQVQRGSSDENEK